MPDWFGIALLYLFGSAVLIAELFLPAHGLLGIAGVGILGFALYETFLMSQVAGLIGLVVLAIILPVGLVISVRTWHRTPIGRRISPPNPRLSAADRLPVEDLKSLVGRHGRSVTLLRPVGTCEFDGRRVECKAEQNVVQKDVPVEAVGLVDRTVVVRPVLSTEGGDQVS
jgi:membrane-bound ClpP family serine protease